MEIPTNHKESPKMNTIEIFSHALSIFRFILVCQTWSIGVEEVGGEGGDDGHWPTLDNFNSLVTPT